MAYVELGSAAGPAGAAGGPNWARCEPRNERGRTPWTVNGPAVSLFCVLANCDADGNCARLAQGADLVGELVDVLDVTMVAVLERPGNLRADGDGDALANPRCRDRPRSFLAGTRRCGSMGGPARSWTRRAFSTAEMVVRRLRGRSWAGPSRLKW